MCKSRDKHVRPFRIISHNMVSKEKATAAMEPVSITPVHLSHTVTANVSSQKITENTACLVTLMDSEANTQRHTNFISVASDRLKGPVLNGTITSHSHIQTPERRQCASHFELNRNNACWHQRVKDSVVRHGKLVSIHKENRSTELFFTPLHCVNKF